MGFHSKTTFIKPPKFVAQSLPMNSEKFCSIAPVSLNMFQGGVQENWFCNAKKSLVEITS